MQRRSASYLTRILHEMEDLKEPGEFYCLGVDMWPWTRQKIFRSLSEDEARYMGGHGNRIKNKFLRPAIQVLRGDSRIKSQADCFVFYSGLWNPLKEKFHNAILDPVIKGLSKKSGSILVGHQGDLSNRAEWQAVDLRSGIFKSRLRARLRRRRNADQNRIEASLLRILSRYDAGYLSKRLAAEVVFRAHEISLFAQYYLRILEESAAKFILMTSYYAPEKYALNLAARNLGISSIDIQHGNQLPFHYAYGTWQNVPPTGYNTLPSHFWTWSEKESQVINTWSRHHMKTELAFVGGNPQIEALSDKRSCDSILLTFQPHNCIDHFLPLLKALSSQDKYTALIRLHPTTLGKKKYLEDLFSTLRLYGLHKDGIIRDSCMTLGAALSRSCLHVTHGSSVVLEAAQHGVRSVVLHQESLLRYQNQVGDSMVSFCEPSDPGKILANAREFTGDHAIETIDGLDRLMGLFMG